jgi:hypothetical protein
MRRFRQALMAALVLAACSKAPEQSAPAASEAAPEASAQAEETVFCPEIERRWSAQECEDFTNLARSAEAGAAAFNAPDPMQRGQTHTLQLAVSYAPPAAREQELARPPATDPQPLTPSETIEPLPGQTVEFTPLVGRFMRAELTGAGFDITPVGPASREVLPDSVTTWTWQVTARERGVQALTLTTVVEGCPANGGACIPLRSTTQNYTVNVAVSPIGEVRDVLAGMPDWIKLVSAIIVAFAGLIGAFFSLRSALAKGRREKA